MGIKELNVDLSSGKCNERPTRSYRTSHGDYYNLWDEHRMAIVTTYGMNIAWRLSRLLQLTTRKQLTNCFLLSETSLDISFLPAFNSSSL